MGSVWKNILGLTLLAWLCLFPLADAQETSEGGAALEESSASTSFDRRTVIEEVIREHLLGFYERRLYLAPNIPPHKLTSAAKIHDFDPSRVLLLYDDGFGKGAKSGFLITDEKIYWRFMTGFPPCSLHLEDIVSVEILGNEFRINGLRNGLEIYVGSSSNPEYAANLYATLLEKIRVRVTGLALPPSLCATGVWTEGEEGAEP